MAQNAAYDSAIERAKQVVSKFNTPDDGHPNGGYVGGKRPSDNAMPYGIPEKRPFNDRAAAAAHEAAAKLSQKIGGGAGVPPPQQSGERQITTETSIPDRYVGLVIGKKGEQITALQNDSNCKIQISQDGGRPDRIVTLTGTPQQVSHAQKLLDDIIDRADKSGGGNGGGGGMGSGIGPPSPPNYHQQMSNAPVYAPSGPVTTVEVLIPGSKAGLVIGKGGETIKQLQEENGVKMVLIQQTSTPTAEDKPLRITGDPARIEKVKALVYDIITRGRMGNFSENAEVTRYAVPAEKAGLVIGKGGESIKEICRVSGSHVEISKEPPPDPSIKIFNIRGNRNEIEQAIRMISERAGIPISRPTSVSSSSVWGQLGYGSAGQGTGAAGRLHSGVIADDVSPVSDAYGASNMPAPTFNPYTGQPDYSAAWIEYYRRQGMHEYAEMIQQQAQIQGGTGSGGQPGGNGGGPPSAVPPVSHPSQQVGGGPPQPGNGGVQYPGGQSGGSGGQQSVGGPPSGAPGGYGGEPGQQGDYSWQQWQQWQAWNTYHQQHGGSGGGPPGGGGGMPPSQNPQGGPPQGGSGPPPSHH